MTASVLVMEMMLVYLVMGWLWVTLAGGTWPAPWIVLAAAPMALLGGRLVPYSMRRGSWFDAAWWGAVAVVVAALAEVGNVLAPGTISGARWNLQFVAGLILAWRGWSLAEGWIDRELVEAELQAGTFVMLLGLLVLVWVAPGGGLLPAVIFMAAGLFGLGTARRNERRGPRATAEGDWLVLLAALVVLMVLIALAVVEIVTPELLLAMLDQGRFVGGMILSGAGALFAWIAGLFPAFGTPPEPAPVPATLGPQPENPPRTIGEMPLPPFWVFELFVTFVGVLFLVFAFRLIYRLLRKGLRSVEISLPKEKEPGPPVSEAPEFSWRSWWRLILAWFRGRGQPESAQRPASARATSAARAEAAEQRSVRALYREFLIAVSRAGFERPPSTTPAELAESVRAARPSTSGPVDTLTDLYERARYGEESVGRDDLSRMRTAVQRARQELRDLHREPAGSGSEHGV